jgi:aspartyl-tRNA(Asn)/glutamyl-tRNA(Gln) amidotransferase subunit A
MSVPTGVGANGLPIGVQVVGRAFDEPMVFRIGRAVEKLSGWESVSLPGG